MPSSKQFISYRALIGQVVARNRTLRQIGQRAVAERLGITQASYSRLETGHSAFSIEQLAVVAERLNMSPHQITAEADEFERRLKAAGHAVVRSVFDANPDLKPLLGAALLAVIVAMLVSG